MKNNYLDSDGDFHLKMLGVHTLFKLEYQINNMYYFKSDFFTTTSGFTIHASLVLNTEKELSITHSRLFYTPDNWTVIEGSLSERKNKILQYLTDIGFYPAVPLLRQHRIDLLLNI